MKKIKCPTFLEYNIRLRNLYMTPGARDILEVATHTTGVKKSKIIDALIRGYGNSANAIRAVESVIQSDKEAMESWRNAKS